MKAQNKTASDPGTKQNEKPEEKPIESDPRFSKIYSLADSGEDLVTIARETGMTKGEIKLVLGLRERKRRSIS